MTDEAIALEYEAMLAYSGESLKTCTVCGTQTHEKSCPICTTEDGTPLELTGDSAIDKALAMISNNETIEDLDALLRGGFEPVPKGEKR